MQAQSSHARGLYFQELQMLYDFGEPVKVGIRETLELLDFQSIVTEPWHHCILIPSRRWNPWLALSEGLWILAGRNDVAALRRFNNNIINFSDDGQVLYGAYGARIYDQVDDLIARIYNDPSDRRAVLSIWNPEDLTAKTKDPPCNDMVMFKLRNGKLNMTVINRSNDIHWGLFAVNLPTFSMLQVYIAARLGCEIGTQTHFSNSLHIYTDMPEVKRITERMLFEKPDNLGPYPAHGLIFTPHEVKGYTHGRIMAEASSALDMEPANTPSKLLFFNFAAEFLKCYENREIPKELKNKYPEFADWIISGEVFLEQTSKRQKVVL